MKKPLKVLSTSALATALMASSLVPSAVVHADETKDVNFAIVVLEKDGNFFEIDKDVYFNEKLIGTKFEPFKIVKSSEDKYYKKDDFYNYKLLSPNLTATFEALDEDEKEIKLDTVGKVVIDEKGNVSYVLDEQPEDRLNETFFYNAA